MLETRIKCETAALQGSCSQVSSDNFKVTKQEFSYVLPLL